MTDEHRLACARFVSDGRKIFSARLRTVAAYGPAAGATDSAGPLSLLVLVDSLTADDLTACAGFAGEWRRAGLATPLVLPHAEFLASLDAFPLEYEAIRATHVVLAGAPPFEGLAVHREDLRRACEVQVKSHVIHLREGYIEAGGNMLAVSRLVTASAPPLLALLQNLARLAGVTATTPAEIARDAADRLGLPGGVVADVLGLAQGAPIQASDPARLFAPYLSMMETLAARIDRWDA